MRLAEVVGALSLAGDVASGLAMEKGLRTVLVATRLAGLAGKSARNDSTVFWVSALRFVGCTAFSPEEAAFAAGDDTSMRKTLVFADFDQPLDLIRRVVRGFAPEAPVLERVFGIGRFVLDRGAPKRFARSHCESSIFFARMLGLSESVAEALNTTGERFDGTGIRRMRGEDIPLASRVSDVADVAELFAWTGGTELACEVLR